MNLTKIAALLTCFNRKQKTLACLEALFNQELPADVDISTYLVDDASTDGTRDAVRQAHTSSQDFFQRWEPILERGNAWGFQRSNER